jgi:AraC-like DNA-binding protein
MISKSPAPIFLRIVGQRAAPAKCRWHSVLSELDPAVSAIWTLTVAPGGQGIVELFPPDLGAEIICRVGPEASTILRGPQLRAGVITIPGGVCYVGARLKLGVAARLFAMPHPKMQNARPKIDELRLDWSARGEVDPDQSLVNAFRARLRGVFPNGLPAPGEGLGHLVAMAIARRGGRTDLDRLAGEFGCSPRHMRRRVLTELGFGPKTAARIVRMRQALHLVARQEHDLAQIALAAGFGDQAHMTREFLSMGAPAPRRMRGQIMSVSDKTAASISA